MPKNNLNLLKTIFKTDLNEKNIVNSTELKETASYTAETLMKAVYQGYGMSFNDVGFDTPDYDKLLHIEQNVYQFSTAKDWHMLKDLTLALKEGDKFLSFNEFKNKAITILDEYNGKYLRTEYNAAIAGSQMASKWVDFEKHPDALLEYRTQEDSLVRIDHAALNKITRPVNDNFWATYYPPNGWNCRCTVIRLNSGKKSTAKETNIAMANCTPQKGFATNLAKSGFVFPKNSAYYIGCPPEVFQVAAQLLPPEHQFNTIHQSKTGGHVKKHANYKPKEDHELLHIIASEKADAGHKVEILPEIHEKEIETRQRVLPGTKPNKNPDLRINSDYVEIKEPVSKKKIGFNISKAAGQADRVIINIKHEINDKSLEIMAHKKLEEHKNLKSIEFRKAGKYIEFIPK